MLTKIRLLLSFLALCVAIPALAQYDGDETQAANWWEESPWSNPDRGFNWYPDPATVAPPPKPKAPPPPQAAKPPKKLNEIDNIKDLGKEVDRLRDVAIMTPTENNVLAYLRAKKFVLDKSSMFADVHRRVVWKSPEVDYNVVSPQANFAQSDMRIQYNRDSASLMNRLAKTHGLLFFYRSDCNFCHIQAPVLRMLQDRYNVEVLAISGDGGPIAQFPNARPDNGIGRFVTNGVGIETYPSVFLVSKDQKQVVPLGAGVMAMDEIVDRIFTLLNYAPNQNF